MSHLFLMGSCQEQLTLFKLTISFIAGYEPHVDMLNCRTGRRGQAQLY